MIRERSMGINESHRKVHYVKYRQCASGVLVLALMCYIDLYPKPLCSCNKYCDKMLYLFRLFTHLCLILTRSFTTNGSCVRPGYVFWISVSLNSSKPLKTNTKFLSDTMSMYFAYWHFTYGIIGERPLSSMLLHYLVLPFQVPFSKTQDRTKTALMILMVADLQTGLWSSLVGTWWSLMSS